MRVEAVVRVERSRHQEHEGGGTGRGVMEDRHYVLAPRPSRLRFANRREGFLVPAQRANPRSLSRDLCGGHPIPGQRGEGLHQLGEVRQLGNAGELALSEREDPAAVRETCRDVGSRQLPRREQESAIRFQPESVIERDAPVEGMRRQGRRLEPEPARSRVLCGAFLAVALVFLELSLAPTPGLDTYRHGGGEDAQDDEKRDAFHERVLS